MQFTDAVTVAGARRTADGYLIADAKAVRTGIQIYRGSEVGKPEIDTVRVYRSESEVRSADSLRSFSHAPITLDHPAQPVTAENWKDLAVGEVSTAATWDGNRISLPLILKDVAAIHAVAGGKRELSAGYTCDLDFTPGVTSDGQAFDAQQKNIRANHLAIVDRGRAGTECRIGDADQHAWGAAPITPTIDKETVTMSDALRSVVVDGLSVQTTDQGAQAIAKLTKDRDDDRKALADAKTAHAAEIKAKDEQIGALTADKKKLEDAAPKPADLDRMVADRVALVTVAKAICNDLKPEGLTDADIRKAVVKAKLGDDLLKDASDDMVAGMFKALAKDVKPTDPVRDVIRGGVQHQANDAATVTVAHAGMVSHLTDAWKGVQPQKGAA